MDIVAEIDDSCENRATDTVKLEFSINQDFPYDFSLSRKKAMECTMKFLQGFQALIQKNKPYVVMIFIQFVYAGMSLLSKAAVSEGMNPYIFVVYRQAFATVALAPFALFIERKKPAPLSFILLFKIFLVTLCGITVSLNLYYFGLNYVSATFATAFTNTIPAITFILAVCLRIEKISVLQSHGIAKVLGSAIGLSGALVFTFLKGPAIFPAMEDKTSSNHLAKTYSKQDWLKGSFIMIMANIAWSLWLIMQGLIIKQYPSKLRLTGLQTFFSCILSAIWAVTRERSIEAWKLAWNINLLSVLYCGIIVTAVSYWLQIWVVEKKGPLFTAIFSPLALVITAIFSLLVFKETLHWGSFCGVLLLVIGLYIVLWGKHREEKVGTNENEVEVKEENNLKSITCQ